MNVRRAHLKLLDHLSASSIRRFQECPKRWAAERFDGARSRPGVALIKGSAVDRFTAENWGHRWKHGTDIADIADRAEHHFRDAVDREGGRDEIEWNGQAFPRALESVQRMAGAHVRDHAAYVGANGSLQHRVNRGLPDGRYILGFIDLLAVDGVVYDVKTGARRMNQADADRDIQATAYAYGLGRPIEFKYLRVIDGARTTTEVVTTTRSAASLEWFEELALSVSALIDAGYAPACPGWHCSHCPINASCVGALTTSGGHPSPDQEETTNED